MTMRLVIPLLIIICLLFAACTEDAKPPRTPTPAPTLPQVAVDHSADPIKIVVSLPIFADMVREVAGSQAQVTALIPLGADPHTYVPTEDQAQAVSDAKIIFYNGNGLEAPTQQFIEAHKVQPVLLVNFTHNVPSPSTQQPLDKPIYAEQVGDEPHLFLDPSLAPVYPATIADSLVIKDGQNQVYYNARFTDYAGKILGLKDNIQNTLNAIPPQNKALLVLYHNSLLHFANRFGLTVAGTLADDGVDGITQILAQKHPPAVFTETGYDNAPLVQAAEAAGIQVCHVETDSIADAGTSYITMMQRDADELARCLGVPPT
jgi:ABC-type Zn uptake system ZnuABC Zn-binding protein ZnuA